MDTTIYIFVHVRIRAAILTGMELKDDTFNQRGEILVVGPAYKNVPSVRLVFLHPQVHACIPVFEETRLDVGGVTYKMHMYKMHMYKMHMYKMHMCTCQLTRRRTYKILPVGKK